MPEKEKKRERNEFGFPTKPAKAEYSEDEANEYVKDREIRKYWDNLKGPTVEDRHEWAPVYPTPFKDYL